MTATASPTGETILCVEGGPPVRRHIRRMLQGQGYQVLEASSGQEALGLAADHRGPIELLVTDAVMPHMSGFTLGERLVESHPETRVLFLSGYTDQWVTGGLQATGRPFLLRPFTHDRLLRTVRDQLDTEAGGEPGSDRRKEDGRRSGEDRRKSWRRVQDIPVTVDRREGDERRTGAERRTGVDRRRVHPALGRYAVPNENFVLVRTVGDGHGAHVRAREGAARGVGAPASD